MGSARQPGARPLHLRGADFLSRRKQEGAQAVAQEKPGQWMTREAEKMRR